MKIIKKFNNFISEEFTRDAGPSPAPSPVTTPRPATKPTQRPTQRPTERPRPGRPTTPTHVPSEQDAPMAVIKRFDELYDDLSEEEQKEIDSHFE